MMYERKRTAAGQTAAMRRTRQGSREREIEVTVACDDRTTTIMAGRNDTTAEIRDFALQEMEIETSNPERYLVIGQDRRPIEGDRTVDELGADGQVLEFRLQALPAFGRCVGSCWCA